MSAPGAGAGRNARVEGRTGGGSDERRPTACITAREDFVASALEGGPIPGAVAAHMAGCPVCREHMDTLAAATLSGSAEEISCAECRSALPGLLPALGAAEADLEGSVDAESGGTRAQDSAVDEDLPAAEADRVHAHLAACPACDSVWRETAAALAALTAGRLAPAPREPNIDLSFLDGLDPAHSPLPRSVWPRRLFLSLLLLVGLMMLALWLLLGTRALGPWREAGRSPDRPIFGGHELPDSDTTGESERTELAAHDAEGASSSELRANGPEGGDGKEAASASGPATGRADATRVTRAGDRSPLAAAADATATARRQVLADARVSATARAQDQAARTALAATRETGTAAARLPATLVPGGSPTPTPTPTATPTPTPTATSPPPPAATPIPDDGPDILEVCRPTRPAPTGRVLQATCPGFPALSEFDQWQLRVERTGRWRLATCGLTALDTILALYPAGGFDPAEPCSGVLAIDGRPAYDDDGCGRQSVLDLRLTPGDYVLIVVEKSGDASAPYRLSVASDRPGAACPRFDPPPAPITPTPPVPATVPAPATATASATQSPTQAPTPLPSAATPTPPLLP
jgi:predicted anti-sigma-YlaC factor YlaD